MNSVSKLLQGWICNFPSSGSTSCSKEFSFFSSRAARLSIQIRMKRGSGFVKSVDHVHRRHGEKKIAPQNGSNYAFCSFFVIHLRFVAAEISV